MLRFWKILLLIQFSWVLLIQTVFVLIILNDFFQSERLIRFAKFLEDILISIVERYCHVLRPFVGNKAKGRISKQVFQEYKARQIFRKRNISYPLIRTRTYYRLFWIGMRNSLSFPQTEGTLRLYHLIFRWIDHPKSFANPIEIRASHPWPPPSPASVQDLTPLSTFLGWNDNVFK